MAFNWGTALGAALPALALGIAAGTGAKVPTAQLSAQVYQPGYGAAVSTVPGGGLAVPAVPTAIAGIPTIWIAAGIVLYLLMSRRLT